jgi:(p)ppGpp synthase/HD superfamily hydrolase
MPELMSPRLDRALRRAAEWHQGQTRKGSSTPYVQHVVAVALVLDRLGFDEDTLIAGLLHDAIEDTPTTRGQIEAEFGLRVAELVGHCTEVKTDDKGQKRPWLDRKTDQLAAIPDAPIEARAILLADKLHNLTSIRLDLAENRPVWSKFNADVAQVRWYYASAIAAAGTGDARLERLARECQTLIDEVFPDRGDADDRQHGS